MGCFGPISALEKIIRLDAKRLRLTEASYTPTLVVAMKIPPQTLRIGAAAVIILGTIILSDHITAQIIIGMLIVLAGVAITRRDRSAQNA